MTKWNQCLTWNFINLTSSLCLYLKWIYIILDSMTASFHKHHHFLLKCLYQARKVSGMCVRSIRKVSGICVRGLYQARKVSGIGVRGINFASFYNFYTPAPQRGRGVYCFTSVRLSVLPSFRPSKIFFVAFFSVTVDGRNLIFGHKLHIGIPYCG
jgi:hypothetical protein